MSIMCIVNEMNIQTLLNVQAGVIITNDNMAEINY